MAEGKQVFESFSLDYAVDIYTLIITRNIIMLVYWMNYMFNSKMLGVFKKIVSVLQQKSILCHS